MSRLVAATVLLAAVACGLTSETQRGRASDLRAENLEQEAAFQRRLIATPADSDAFLRAYAGTDAARRELITRQADAHAAHGCSGVLTFLQQVHDNVSSEHGQSLRIEAAVRRAELLVRDCRDDEAAVVAARDATQLAVKTQWQDDADWVFGRACEQAGKLEEALGAYDRIVRSRSDAFPFGSNDSVFLDDAWLAKGLVLEKLGRLDEARAVLEDLLEARDTRLRPKVEAALARMLAQ